MKIPSISLRSCSCSCQLPRRGIVKELRWVKFKRVGPGCHGGEGLSWPCQTSTFCRSLVTSLRRQEEAVAQVDGPQAVCIHYLTETCCREAGPETLPPLPCHDGRHHRHSARETALSLPPGSVRGTTGGEGTEACEAIPPPPAPCWAPLPADPSRKSPGWKEHFVRGCYFSYNLIK